MQVEFHTIGRGVREFMGEQAEAVARGGVALLRSIRKYLAIALADQFEQLPEANRGADLIIGAGVQAAAASTAETHGLPYPLRHAAPCPSITSHASTPLTPIPYQPNWRRFSIRDRRLSISASAA
jgi:hypothetical protein